MASIGNREASGSVEKAEETATSIARKIATPVRKNRNV
jgi:hypothetical protein